MGTKVRRILFEGHLLFSVPDMTEYLEMGDFRRKMDKVGLMPLTLPLPKELRTQAGQPLQHDWMTWDDVYKMDQRFKWSGSEIGKKLAMVRMWSRNKDGDAYRLTMGGDMVLVEQRPKVLKDVGEFIETVVDLEVADVRQNKARAKAKHEQDKVAVQQFHDKVAMQKAAQKQSMVQAMRTDSQQVDEHLTQAKLDLGQLMVDLDYMPKVDMFDHPVRVVAMVMIEGVEMPLLLQQDFCLAVGIHPTSSMLSSVPETDRGFVSTTGERNAGPAMRTMCWISLRAGVDLLRRSNKTKARELAQQLNTVDWRVIMTGKYEPKGMGIVPMQEQQALTVSSDVNLDLMAIVENVQVESIKERREMRAQMEKLILGEQANTQTIVQELAGVIKHITNKFDMMFQVDTTQQPKVNVVNYEPEVVKPEVTPEDNPVPVTTEPAEPKKRRVRKGGPFVPQIPKRDPLPGQPKIIGQDERTLRFVREKVGKGYDTTKMFLNKRGKRTDKYQLSLAQRARGELERQGRLHELYSVPSPKPTRGPNPNTSNENAYPVDVLEKAYATMEFEE